MRIRKKNTSSRSFETKWEGLTKIITNCSQKEFLPVIKGKVLEGLTVYTDGWKSYDGLILYGYKHRRIHHSRNEFARKRNHVNDIESFWSYVKRRLRKFKWSC